MRQYPCQPDLRSNVARRHRQKSDYVAVIRPQRWLVAKLHGLIPVARPVLERLQPAGYFIHLRIIETVLQDIGE